MDYQVVHMPNIRCVQWHVVNKGHTHAKAEALWKLAYDKVPGAIKERDHNQQVCSLWQCARELWFPGQLSWSPTWLAPRSFRTRQRRATP